MVLGMSLAGFTLFHVILSLIGIATGLIVAIAMLNARLSMLSAVFLGATALTDITGFMFPMPFDPAFVVAIVDLAAVLAACLALYMGQLKGAARWVYVASALFALYLNCVVLVVQSVEKIPFLHQYAPDGKGPALAATQGVVMVLFIGLGVAALRKFRPIAQVARA